VTEHWFMTVMLAIVGLEGAVAVYFGYLVYRKSEHLDGVTGAIYLEARKIPSQHR
jgi:hypothetical protein